MTRQTLIQHYASIDGCSTCRNYEPGDVFILCNHELSKYNVAGRDDLHTCSHMRQPYGACGPDHKLKTRS